MPEILSDKLTTEDLLAMEDGVMDRWLIRGELREKPMTVRNRFHGRVTILIGHLLEDWLETQPEPRGQILGGEAGVILRRKPATTVGIDVCYVSAEVLAKQTDDSTLIDGIPTLVVEVLSPSDTQKEITEKVKAYQEAGVPVIWVVSPIERTVLVYSPDGPQRLLLESQEITAEPHLPGFRVAVSQLFK